jgi:hypothetical protein
VARAQKPRFLRAACVDETPDFAQSAGGDFAPMNKAVRS